MSNVFFYIKKSKIKKIKLQDYIIYPLSFMLENNINYILKPHLIT